MTNSWAQFEANLRHELGRDESDDEKIPPPAHSSSSLLKKNDLFLFGSGSVSSLLVVSCHVCGALTKPAFLAHHINKIHGTVKSHGSSSNSSTPHTTPPPKFKNPPIHKQIKHIKQQAMQCKRSTAPKEEPIKVTIKYPQPPLVTPLPPASKPKKKEPSKRKESKKKEDKKSKKIHKIEEKDKDLFNFKEFCVASPPPSPPSLYPSPTRNTVCKAKRKIITDPKVEVPREEIKTKPGVFDFKSLIKQLPAVCSNPYYHKIPVEVTREHRNGLIYQHQRPRPLGDSHYGGRSMGSGQVVFTRRSDNLRAALNALLPNQTVHKCTSEIRATHAVTTAPPVQDYQSSESQCSRNQRTEDFSDSFSSSRQNSPAGDKLFDIFDSDILEKSLTDDFLFGWNDYGDPNKLSNKLFSNPGTGNKSNIPKLKVDTNQIKSNSAMAVFEFDDPEEGRRVKEEERLRLLRTGNAPTRKNKRKITKSPSQASTPKSNGNLEQPSPSSSFTNKRGRYEVIELDKSPSPSTSPIKHCVASPRQFSYMIGYSEQSAT